MPNPPTLGDAIHAWRVRRQWYDVVDLANGMINDGFVSVFSAHGLDEPDTATLGRALSDLEAHNVWPWISPPYDQWMDLWDAFVHHCARCLRLSKEEVVEMKVLVSRCVRDNIHP